MRAAIAGGGVSGLAAALALSRAGFEVEVYERSATLQEFGAGLQLAPNATRMLSALGVLEAVRTVSTSLKDLRVFRGSDDQLLANIRLDDAERRWGAPYLAVHRADLQRCLAEAVERRPNVQLQFGTTVVASGSDEHGVVIDLKRGATTGRDRADLLIAADGLHSRVRKRFELGPADDPVFAGNIAFRATLESSAADRRWGQKEVSVCLGPGAHLVVYPLRSGSILNIVAVIQSGRNRLSHERDSERIVDRSAFDRSFADWSRATRRLLASANAWRAWPIFVRPPIASFCKGPVALVGDAAHPMVPFLAQGAGQAIEDAGALFQVFGRPRGIPEALLAYSRKRVARAARVQIAAQNQGRVYHLTGATASARDAGMSALGPERLRSQYDWLYSS